MHSGITKSKIEPSPKIIIRIDDLCPTMNWQVWQKLENVFLEHQIKPLLAVVPDNQDPKLKIAPPATDFWDRIRNYQELGWSIALHGHQHVYTTKNRGLVGRRKASEFAGVPIEIQEDKLRKGMEIFKNENINSVVWIAPSHTFDIHTVSILPKIGIQIISDGFHRLPFKDEHGLLWMPQQLWELRPIVRGVWTVCYHINRWTAHDIEQFRKDVERFRPWIVSLDEVIAQYANRRRSIRDRVYSHPKVGYYLTRLELMFHHQLPPTDSTHRL